MRSRDLKTDGTVYYYTSNDSWLKWSHHAEQVTIIDATAGHWRWEAREDKWTRTPGGQQVLVEIAEIPGVQKKRQMAVRTVCLRGEWDKACADLANYRRMRQAYRDEQRAKVDAVEQPCEEAVKALYDLGITASTVTSARHLWADVVIPHKDAHLLTAAAQHLLATGWKPPVK